MILSLLEKLKIRVWQRSQFDSQPLRKLFREKYRVDVGYYSYGCFDQWRMPGPIKIGRYCSIANSVRTVPINHPYDAISTHPMLYERKFGVVEKNIHYDDPLVIEDDVWIGHNAIILPGCKFIGRGSIIGAGSIVTKPIPAYSIVAGNPAKKLRDRFTTDMIEAIEASRWWELDAPELKKVLGQNPEVLLKPNPALLTILHS
ncbi:CatB-related O-acetyltransferase [Novosphingobium umbonatum]|nr:CatB-related O-acetyltransferase [Novosphingobium umbonatum]